MLSAAMLNTRAGSCTLPMTELKATTRAVVANLDTPSGFGISTPLERC
jgi:hypothetical protein